MTTVKTPPLQPVGGTLKPGRQAQDIKDFIKRETFRLHSDAIVLTMLAIFAGQSRNIPRQLLDKPEAERTAKERQEASAFLGSIFHRSEEMTLSGFEERTYAVVCSNPVVDAKAEAEGPLFRYDESHREEILGHYIKKTFGPEGLRHLLGLIIGLEEQGDKDGSFVWDINEHLERIGYRRKGSGSFGAKEKETASRIIGILGDLYITATRRDKSRDKPTTRIQGMKLFTVTRFDESRDDTTGELTAGRKVIRAENHWYGSALDRNGEFSKKYTRLLKKVAKENHRNHPLTLFLAPLLAVFWRIGHRNGSVYKITFQKLADWCDFGLPRHIHNRNWRREIGRFESELNYMKTQGYLGEWSHDGEEAKLADCKDPLSCVLTLTPPGWLKDCFAQIGNKGEEQALPEVKSKIDILTPEEVRTIRETLNQGPQEFGNNLGVSRQFIYYVEKGKRKIGQEFSDKVRAYAEEMGLEV